MRPQPRRPNVLDFVPRTSDSKERSVRSSLDFGKCAMARATLRNSPVVAEKVKRLQAAAPDLWKIVEELIDDLLSEVS